MDLYTIYYDTLDYPHTYVCRRFKIEYLENKPIAKEVFMIDDDLEKIREALYIKGLFPITRDENDDPKIIETWL